MGTRSRRRSFSLRQLDPSTEVALGISLGSVMSGGALVVAGSTSAAHLVWAVGPVMLLPGLAAATLRGIWRREPGVDVIALLAMAGALLAGEFLAGAIIAVMLAGGRTLEEAAGRRAELELTALIARAPRVAHLLRDDEIVDVGIEEVVPSDLLVVKTGEVVGVDGVLVDDALLDESTLTGESRPVVRSAQEHVASGVTNIGGSITLRATATADQSTYAGIVRLVEQARSTKSPFVRLADRSAAWFVPLTIAVAVAAWATTGDATRALAVLVVATPCPLLLAAPIAITSGISRAARRGVIVKDGGALEAMAAVTTICFDKTGTLTTGHPRLVEAVAEEGWDADAVLRLAASAEQLSAHPFAPALVAAAGERGLALLLPGHAEESPGEGVVAQIDGQRVAVGSLALVLGQARVPADGAIRSSAVTTAVARSAAEGASVAFVGVDGEYAGALHFEDPLRADAVATIRRLREYGITEAVMLTGDQRPVAQVIGAAAGMDRVLAELSPSQKVAAVHDLGLRGPTAMVGDGINDAPALAVASVGIAMAARGATASSEAADIVITVDRIDRLAEARLIARSTTRIARQSVLIGMGLSMVAMGAAALGFLTPVAGAVLQEGIDVATILNALRALRIRSEP